MPTLHDCLGLIASTKASARNTESAYVLRTRIKRSLLGVSQWAAEYAGVAGTLMPDDIDRVHCEDPKSAKILGICVSLLSKTRSLCQPSEALDSRWHSGWDAVCYDLDILERELLSTETIQ
jgi:hypothetical protein